MNAIASLCKFCSDPHNCPLCDLMRFPQPLTGSSIARIAAGHKLPAPKVALKPQMTRAAADLAHADRSVTIQQEIERIRQENEALRAKAAARTAPKAPPAAPPAESKTVLVPAFVPAAAPAPVTPPAPVVTFPAQNLSAALRPMDWVGLAARVDAGLLTQAEAERIGQSWFAPAAMA